MFNKKYLKGMLDKFWSIFHPKDIYCGWMLGNDILSELVGKNLHAIFYEIYQLIQV